MDAFKDEVYENMDDISKLIEPFEYSLNNELAQFPDEIQIDAATLKGILSYDSWGESWSQSLSSAIQAEASKLKLDILAKEVRGSSFFVSSMFEFVEELDSETGSIFYNFETNEITGGKLFIRKKKVAVEDLDIEQTMDVMVSKVFNDAFNMAKEVNKKRLNEIAEMFGAKQARKERSWRKKTTHLKIHIQKMIKDKALVIKDVELFSRFLQWNIMYIKDGKLPAMANLARVKIMMRNGMPIYSIKEEQV